MKRVAGSKKVGLAKSFVFGGLLLAIFQFMGMPELVGFSGRAMADEDHAPPRTIMVAPRTELRIGNQELVAAYDRNKLVLFLQRYSDGEPTTGAHLEVTVDFVPVNFDEVAPGTYVASDVMLAAGRNELELAYKIGDREGTENLMLLLPQAAVQLQAGRQSSMPSATASGLLLAAIAGAIYLGVTAVLALRSRVA